jgi:surface protein
MSSLFYECSSLKNLDISNFNTINVTDMSNMFYECSSLEKLYLPSFDVNAKPIMNKMFYRCKSLKDLRCSNKNIMNEYKKKFDQ